MEIKELNGVLYYSGVGLPDNNVRPEVESVFFYINEETQKKYVWTINRISGVGNWIELGDTLRFIIFDELPEPSEEYSTTIALILNPTSTESEDEYDEYACIYNNELSAWEWEKLNSHIRFWSNYYYDADGNLILSKQEGGEIIIHHPEEGHWEAQNTLIWKGDTTGGGTFGEGWTPTTNACGINAQTQYLKDPYQCAYRTSSSSGYVKFSHEQLALSESDEITFVCWHGSNTSARDIYLYINDDRVATFTQPKSSTESNTFVYTIPEDTNIDSVRIQGSGSSNFMTYEVRYVTNVWVVDVPAWDETITLPPSLTIGDPNESGVNVNIVGESLTFNGSKIMLWEKTENGGYVLDKDVTNVSADGSLGVAHGNSTHANGNSSHAEGTSTTTIGVGSHTEGFETRTEGDWSHAEGRLTQTVAGAQHSHAEGNVTIARGVFSHAEGTSTNANGEGAHAEGLGTFATGNWSHAEGNGTNANGAHSHAEGNGTNASGAFSHAEGTSTSATTDGAHAEGQNTTASGIWSHAEGQNTTASGIFSHAEGQNTTAIGSWSHTEGNQTRAEGNWSHAEGQSTTASGALSHAEGKESLALAEAAHAEGYGTYAYAIYSHAEGQGSQAHGSNSHAEGYSAVARGTGSHAEGGTTNAVGDFSHAEGSTTTASGMDAHAEGSQTRALSNHAHAEGLESTASNIGAHAEGRTTSARGQYSHAEGGGTIASADYSHAEGQNTTASNVPSHAEGANTTASGPCSHAEGNSSIAAGNDSHAEGHNTRVGGYEHGVDGPTPGTYSADSIGEYAHAEGNATIAKGNDSHAEGKQTLADGYAAHAEGYITVTRATAAHAEGNETIALGNASHAEGVGTKAQNISEHAEGSYNTTHRASDTYGNGGNTQHSIGIGAEGDGNNKNAVEVMQNGDFYMIGVGNYQGTNTKVQDPNILTVQEVINGSQHALIEGDNIDITNNVISVVGIIDDSDVSTTSTYSSTKIESIVDGINQRITDDEEVVSAALNDLKIDIDRIELECEGAIKSITVNGTRIEADSDHNVELTAGTLTLTDADNKTLGWFTANSTALIQIPEATSSEYGFVKVDNTLDSTSTNPVENRVITSAISSLVSIRCEVVSELPATGENGVIYFVPNDGSEPNIYDEYIWIDSTGKFELIGTTEIDLTNYVTKDDLNDTLLNYISETELTNILNNYVTDSEFDNLIEDVNIQLSDIDRELSTKQDKLIEGYGIDITGNTISVESEFVTESELNEILSYYLNDSDGYVISSAINELYDTKQDKLTAGNNITISNDGVISADVPTVGAGNLNIKINQSGTVSPVSGFNANQDSDEDIIFSAGSNVTLSASGNTITISATGGGEVGTLNTTNTTSLTPQSGESLSGTIDLHKISKTGSYSDLIGAPTLATVATSGSYNDLSNKPTIPAAQVNVDWNASSGVSEILNKPTLASVATSGSYDDLINKPTIPTVGDGSLHIKVDQSGSEIDVIDFNANQDSSDDITFVAGSNITLTPDTTNKTITIAATGGISGIDITVPSDDATYPILLGNTDDSESDVPSVQKSVGLVVNPNKKSVAEGDGTVASGYASHAEGYATNGGTIQATSQGAHAGGYAIGSGTIQATSEGAHAEGYVDYGGTIHASAIGAHAEGYAINGSMIIAKGAGSHAEGVSTTAYGYASHAEGQGSSLIISNSDISERAATTITFSTLPSDIKIGSVIKDANGAYAKVTNINTSTKVVTVNSNLSTDTTVNLYLVYGIAYGNSSHAEGYDTTASGDYSHVGGYSTTASGDYSHAEGYNTTASEYASHAEGENTRASGDDSHAEGDNTTASGYASHAEGESTTASNTCSHAEGNGATASGGVSHAEGWHTTASGDYSHASGQYTIANRDAQTVVGKYNDESLTDALFVVGNGTGIDSASRSNAFYVKTDGSVYASGAYYAASDKRKKDIIGYIDLEKAYSLLENCQTVIYTWKDDESKKQQIGVIAQEIQQFFPEIVNEDEHGMLSVDYSRLTVILMSVIKNNIKEMKSLEERIKLLEEKIR